MSSLIPVIEAHNLKKSYGGKEVLSGLDLKVEAGQIYALVGPDGVGKSTILRILSTLIKADGGEIKVLGLPIPAEIEKIRTLIGYMPQQFSLFEDLTVEENMRFFGDIFSLPPASRQKREQELLQFSRLAPFARRKVANLSGGMKQKLALSCALMHSPPLLFLDEPTTGVDPISRREFWQLLFLLQEEGTTIVLASPYLEEAERASRVAFLSHGRVLKSDRPENFLSCFVGGVVMIRPFAFESTKDFIKREFPNLSLHVFADTLHLFSQDPQALLLQLEERFSRFEVRWKEMKIIPASLEDVFVQLLEKERRLGSDSD